MVAEDRIARYFDAVIDRYSFSDERAKEFVCDLDLPTLEGILADYQAKMQQKRGKLLCLECTHLECAKLKRNDGTEREVFCCEKHHRWFPRFGDDELYECEDFVEDFWCEDL